MSLDHALLGCLHYGPMTGYEVKRIFDTGVSFFWNVPLSQIYSVFRRLEKEGNVESEIVYQETKPNRKLYRITNQGEAMFREWMSHVRPSTVLRNPFLLQIYFAGHVDDAAILNILEEERERLLQRLAKLKALPDEIPEDASGGARMSYYWWLTLHYGITRGRAQVEWIDEAIERIRRGEPEDGKAGALRGLFDQE